MYIRHIHILNDGKMSILFGLLDTFCHAYIDISNFNPFSYHWPNACDYVTEIEHTVESSQVLRKLI